jgi:hypothetical protein
VSQFPKGHTRGGPGNFSEVCEFKVAIKHVRGWTQRKPNTIQEGPYALKLAMRKGTSCNFGMR